MQTNFFRAFVASSIQFPSIYIQQFWDTIRYDKIAGCYKCQLDKQWFNLTKDTLRDALQITPVDINNAFSSPPTTDALVHKLINLLPYKATNKFHQRPESPLHLPTEESVLGYLKFSAKGTKREVFGMPILNELITDDIRGAQYYNAYLEKVAKHQRYLAGEEVSDPDSPAPKPAKATKQSKPLAPKGATMKPKPVPAKPKEKKRKLVTETSEAPSPAKQSKAGKVAKKRTKKSSPRLVDEFVDEGVPENEPRIGDEEADLQKALEESLKDVHSVRQGPLPPVVIREPESGKFQPLLEVPGKGKDKVGEEQAAQVLLNLQTPKKKSHAEYDTESDKEMPPVVTSGAQDEGQARPNPGIQDEGQAGPNPGDDAAPQPQSTPVVHAGPSLKHHVFGDQFFNDKPSEADNENTTADTEDESMVSVTIHQDTYAITLMTSPVIDVTSRPDSPNIHRPLPTTATATATTTTTTTTHPLPPQPHQVSLIHLDKAHRDRFRDLPEADMKEILHHQHVGIYFLPSSRMITRNVYKALDSQWERDHNWTASNELWCRNSGASGSSQVPSPPPPPSTNQGVQSISTAAPSSSKTAASAEYTAWTTTDTRIKPSVSSTPEELHMDDDTTADEQAYSSGGEDIGRDHIPTVNLRQSWWKPLTEDRPATPEPAWSIPSSDLTVPKNNWASALTSTYAPPPENSLLAQTGDMKIFMDWYCKRQGITELTQKDLEGPAYEIVKVFHPNVIHLQFQMEECHKLLTDQVDDAILRYNVSKPLPLGGEPGHVTIQPDFFFNKDLEYLRYGRKIGRLALSILKMKAAYYHDVGLEQMAFGTHMQSCCIGMIEVFSLYGYDYMKKIVLRRADLKEYIIAERDFKYLYPSDFEDLYLLNLQGHLNHLSPEDKKILTTAVNLWTRNLYKHDFTVIDSPRAVTFRDKYGVQMIMRFNEIHKFSDGTLQQIDEALDYRVKEFKVNRMNPGLNTRFWTKKDVDRSKEFMFAIEIKRLA
ncbi:copia protein [Tanacetum coccineum]